MNPVLTEGYGQPYPRSGLHRTRDVSVVDPGSPVITGSIINERELSVTMSLSNSMTGFSFVWMLIT